MLLRCNMWRAAGWHAAADVRSAKSQQVKKGCKLQITSSVVTGSNPQIQSVLKLNDCLCLTCCREWEWQENSSCVWDIKVWDVVALTPPSPVVVAPVRTPWPSHRHTGSKHGPLTPPSCLCVRVSVSANLPVKTCFVSWAQLYTCYPGLTGWSPPSTCKHGSLSEKRFFESVYTLVQMFTPLFMCVFLQGQSLGK